MTRPFAYSRIAYFVLRIPGEICPERIQYEIRNTQYPLPQQCKSFRDLL